MNPPPNPHAAEARAAMQAHNAPLLQNPPAPLVPPADLLDRIFERWPDMQRYKNTARIERVDYWLRSEPRWCWMVTVIAFDKAKGSERDEYRKS